ncbi:hypothetical protein GX51_01309 [Blastomyces parvus]|uniref:Uncharacterized protein n=1 Tax=Blastomyces parvus TaxID=2060905 RepID=A0A2B7XG93_9EURO|nr:hypothetical protein GX51_01309 [Blastomyces parvus]
MPPKKNSLKNPTRPDKPDKPVLKTSHQKTKQQARRAHSATKSKINRERQHRLALGGNTRSQKTLTQIDFVKRAQALLALDDEDENDGLELEYIDGNNWDGEYGESGQSSKRAKSSGNERTGGTEKKSGIAARKEVDETDLEDDERSLTQKGYVIRSSRWRRDGGTRHLHPGLGKRKGVPLMETIGEEPEAEMSDETLQEASTNCDNHIGKRSKKRKASEANVECHSSQIVSPSHLNAGTDTSAAGPVTPRRPTRLVVPSSQSPDSPILTISPRIFKGPPPKFPLAPLSHNVTPKKAASPLKNEYKTPNRGSRMVPYEISESSFYSAGTGSPTRSCAEESVIGLEITPTTSPPACDENSNKTLSTSSQNPTRIEGQEAGFGNPGTNFRDVEKSKNRVIYETDAETEDEEVHDSIFQISGSDNDSWRTQSQLFHDCKSGNDDSDGDGDDNTLHGVTTQHRNSDRATCHTLPEHTLGSEPSMLYYRQPMSLTFDPGSELNDIDTQRLAELFPAVEAENQEGAILPLSTIPEEEHESQQGEREDETTAACAENSQTNLVPNSPPAQQLNTAIEGNIPPPSSPPVVLVASSQQSDVGDAEPDQDGCTDSQIGCQGLVTASQLLTDSMMESVPGPPIWMFNLQGSQEEQEDMV